MPQSSSSASGIAHMDTHVIRGKSNLSKWPRVFLSFKTINSFLLNKIFITIFWHSFFNLSRMAYQNNMHRGIYFYFIKTIFAIFLEKHYLHSWVGMKHAYLHQSLYRAIFKFVTNVIIWSNYYTTSIVFLFCLQNSTLKILNFFNKKIIEILEKTNSNMLVIFIPWNWYNQLLMDQILTHY